MEEGETRRNLNHDDGDLLTDSYAEASNCRNITYATAS